MAGPITVALDKEPHTLWSLFHSHTAEMIVTKERGRKLFPRLEYTIRGLQSDRNYLAVLVFRRVDEMRYKYSCGEWQHNGNGDVKLPEQPQFHQDGVVSGRQMMCKKLNFDYLRITNNPQHAHMVILQSMHKYKVVLYIYEVYDSLPLNEYILQDPNRARPVCIFEPEYTEFIAVTAYFNEKIKKLKIDKNKYAKGHKTVKSEGKMKSCSSPSPSLCSTYTTPNVSPESENSLPAAMRGLQYPQVQPMWPELYNNAYLFQQYQFPDMFQYPTFFPTVPPAVPYGMNTN